MLNPHSLLPESLSLCSSFAVTIIVFASLWSGIFQVGLDMHLLSCLSTTTMLSFTFLILSDTKIIKFCTNPNVSYLQNLMFYEFASITAGLKYIHLKMKTSLICSALNACLLVPTIFQQLNICLQIQVYIFFWLLYVLCLGNAWERYQKQLISSFLKSVLLALVNNDYYFHI